MICRVSFFFSVGLIGFSLSACTGATMPIPANLQESGKELSVSFSGKMLSNKHSLVAGPYTLRIHHSQTDDVTNLAEGKRTTELVNKTLEFSKAGEKIFDGRCVGTRAWTQVEGELLARDTINSYVCEGHQAGQGNWRLVLNEGEGNGYEGSYEGSTGVFSLTSLHERSMGMQGPLRGYALAGPDAQSWVAVRRGVSSQPGAIYFDARAESDPSLLGIALALTLYNTDY